MRLRSRQTASSSLSSPMPAAPSETESGAHDASTVQGNRQDPSLHPNASQNSSPKGKSVLTKRELTLRWAYAVGLVLLLGVLAYTYWNSLWLVTMGRVMANQSFVTSPLKGRISSIPVKEGEVVTKGELLVQLDDEALQADIKKAQAALLQAQAKVVLLQQSGITPSWRTDLISSQRDFTVAQHRLDRTQASQRIIAERLHEAERQAEQAKELMLLQAISRAQWEERNMNARTVKAEYREAQARVSEESAALRGALKILNERRSALEMARISWKQDIEFLRHSVWAAKADLEATQARVRMLSVYAPYDGVIGWIPRSIGEVIDHDDTILGIIEPNNVSVIAYVEGNDLIHVQQGQAAKVKFEGLSDEYYEGTMSLMYTNEEQPGPLFSIGPNKARAPVDIPDLMHPVRVILSNPPPKIRPEMIAWVWIDKT